MIIAVSAYPYQSGVPETVGKPDNKGCIFQTEQATPKIRMLRKGDSFDFLKATLPAKIQATKEEKKVITCIMEVGIGSAPAPQKATCAIPTKRTTEKFRIKFERNFTKIPARMALRLTWLSRFISMRPLIRQRILKRHEQEIQVSIFYRLNIKTPLHGYLYREGSGIHEKYYILYP